MLNVAFIVGSPRSGTTVLGEILDLHPQIAHWYEPYFVYDRYFRFAEDDRRTASDATQEVTDYLRREVIAFQNFKKGSIVIDKSPRNSLKIPFLRKIFPEAKFVHLLRDGRDVTLSLSREWQTRRSLVEGQNNFGAKVETFWRYLSRQPMLRHKLQAAMFQIGNPLSVFSDRLSGARAVRRWNGRVGFGPQFPDWEDIIDTVPELTFNAMQWQACVQTILEDTQDLDSSHLLTMRYEDFLNTPMETLGTLLEFLELNIVSELSDNMPKIKSGNYNKWVKAFSPDEKQSIGPTINPLLLELGYAENDTWYRESVPNN